MAPGGIRLELVRIRREIRRTKTLLPRDGFPVLDAASRDHQRMLREIAGVRQQHREELLALAANVQQEGQRARIALEWFTGP